MKEASKPREAGEECWQPLHDKRTPPSQIPPCATCGAPSWGGRVLDVGPVGYGGPVWDLEFFCKAHVKEPGEFPVVTSIALYPAYRILGDLGPGKMRVVRLDRDQMLARVAPRR